MFRVEMTIVLRLALLCSVGRVLCSAAGQQSSGDTTDSEQSSTANKNDNPSCTAELPKLSRPGRCTVDVVSAADLTPDIFAEKYHLQKPLIITDVTASPGPADAWTTDALVRTHGETVVGIGSSRALTRMGGTGLERAPLGAIVKKMRSLAADGKDADVYVFDRDSKLFTDSAKGAALLDAVKATGAAMLGEVMGAGADSKAEWSYYLAAGGVGSGVHLHHHSDGWAYNFEGSKRWFFQPPHKLPPISHMGRVPMRYWYEKGVYPQLRQDELPVECVQRAGELIYVPEGWWHGTLNEGPGPVTLSFAAQRNSASALTELERQLQAAMEAKKFRAYPEAIKKLKLITKKWPENTEAWYMLGIVYGKLRGHENTIAEELEVKKKAVELTGKRQCDAMINLGSVLVETKQFKPALKILDAVTTLCEWEANPWMNKAAAYEQMGQMPKAEEMFLKYQEIQQRFDAPFRLKIAEHEVVL